MAKMTLRAKARRLLEKDPNARPVDIAKKIGSCSQTVIDVRRIMEREARAAKRKAARHHR